MVFARTVRSRLILVGLAVAPLLAAPQAPAQRGRGIFVTPIPGAPFVGEVSVERTVIQADGKTVTVHTSHMIARDSEGRIRNEVRAFQPAGATGTPPLIRVHLYDPQTRLTSYLNPRDRTFWVDAVDHPPATDAPDAYASPAGSDAPPSQFAGEKDLGTRTIAGMEVHGVRETQTIPGAASGTGQDMVVTDEYWYSYDLKMNLAVTHTDPRTGSVTMTVTLLSRAEPDASLFTVPADYQSAVGR